MYDRATENCSRRAQAGHKPPPRYLQHARRKNCYSWILVLLFSQTPPERFSGQLEAFSTGFFWFGNLNGRPFHPTYLIRSPAVSQSSSRLRHPHSPIDLLVMAAVSSKWGEWEMGSKEFWKRALRKFEIDPVTGCWLWTGKLDKDGYGYIAVRNYFEPVHKVAAQFALGFKWKLRDWSTHVYHHCDNPRCFNPLHLYVGNARTNGEDRLLATTHTLEQRRILRLAQGYLSCLVIPHDIAQIFEEVSGEQYAMAA